MVQAVCHRRRLLLGEVPEDGHASQAGLVALPPLCHRVDDKAAEGGAVHAPQHALSQRCMAGGEAAGEAREEHMRGEDGMAGGRRV